MQRILIVEDEYFIADDCAKEVQAHGLGVVGPIPSLNEALTAAKTSTLGGAIVDSNLRGKKAYRVADVLVSRNIPFVFYTGYPKVSLPNRFASIPCFEKPLMQHAAIRELLNRLGRDAQQPTLG
jgi:ActR/RegA family two-component response regulator